PLPRTLHRPRPKPEAREHRHLDPRSKRVLPANLRRKSACRSVRPRFASHRFRQLGPKQFARQYEREIYHAPHTHRLSKRKKFLPPPHPPPPTKPKNFPPPHRWPAPPNPRALRPPNNSSQKVFRPVHAQKDRRVSRQKGASSRPRQRDGPQPFRHVIEIKPP